MSGELPPEDLELLAWSAYLTDEVVQVVAILERAYAGYVAAGNKERAAAVAVQLAHEYGSIRLQKAVGSGGSHGPNAYWRTSPRGSHTAISRSSRVSMR